MEIATIGFTQSSAESFFERIRAAKLPVLVDVRLQNTSQLAGFAKREDLSWFLRELCGVEYMEEKVLAASEEDMHAYRGKEMTWDEYERRYEAALKRRDAINQLDRARYERGVILLCSEAKPDRCHRRLAAEYLSREWPNVTVRHL